jgi:signal transduction histidine kinase
MAYGTSPGGRIRRGPATVLGAAAAVCLVVALVLNDLSDRPTRNLSWPVDLAFNLLTIGAGLAVWWRRPDTAVGRRMVVAGFLMFASVLLRSNNSWAFTIGNLLAAAGVAVLAHVIVTYPSSRAETILERAVVVSIYTVAIFVSVARALTTDFRWTCSGCPINELYVGGYPDVFDALNAVSAVLLVIVNLAGGVTLAARWWRAGRAGRRVLALPYASVLLILVVLLVRHPGFDNRGPVGPEGIAGGVALLTFPLALAAGLLRGHLSRAAASDLLIDLGHDTDLEAAVGRALGDPSVRLLQWDEHGSTFRDGAGRAVPELAEVGRRRAVVERDGQRVAALVHDAALADEPERLAAVLSAVGLALDRMRLTEEVRAQLDEVASSRARILSAADEERRRIQRDLHDGAQQRLVGVSILVRRARSRALATADSDQAQLLTEAADEVNRSLREIRELARGLRPPLLDEQGLLAALDSLAERAAIPTTVRGCLDTRLPTATESAAYFVASESLANTTKHAAATSATITVNTEADVLVLSVADDGRGGATLVGGGGLYGLRDRVEALDGTIEVRSPLGEGTIVTARLPSHQ